MRRLTRLVRDHGINGCEAAALDIASRMILNGPILNVGGGVNGRWRNAECVDAMHDPELDFNTKPLPVETKSLGLVVCEQVIEHLHNTTFFLSELFRVLRVRGQLLISTENLVSLPNLFAMLCQRAPFSTQAVCGQFVGGWKHGPAGDNFGAGTNPSHPAFAGVRGHVRVMTVGQIFRLLTDAGFEVIEKRGFGFNHYVLFHCLKPGK